MDVGIQAAWIGLAGALGGVFVGGLISYVTTTLGERAKGRRETAIRWEGRLIDAVAKYASVLKMQSRMCLRIAGGYWPQVTSNPIGRAEGAQLLARFEDERSGNFEQLRLLANAEVVASARAWQDAVWALHAIQDGPGIKFDRVDFQRAFEDAGVLRDAFYATARQALGVLGSVDPTPKRAYR